MIDKVCPTCGAELGVPMGAPPSAARDREREVWQLVPDGGGWYGKAGRLIRVIHKDGKRLDKQKDGRLD